MSAQSTKLSIAVIFCLAQSAQCGSVLSENVPPRGVEIPADARVKLAAGVQELNALIATLAEETKAKAQLNELLPDVEIFANAVRFALEDDLFYGNKKNGKIDDVERAVKLLEIGTERALQLRAGQSPWTTQTGPVVRGYRSRLDGTAIPYGLLVPAGYSAAASRARRLDIWLHGRDDTLSEIKFISGRLNGKAEFMPAESFVLQPYGRYCNAYKLAGEMDVLESLAHVSAHYSIDPAKIAMRGFSMGGAGAWHLGARHTDLWAAVNPGAGFVDVKNYVHIADDDVKYPWYERKLWHWYNPLEIALNLTNTKLVAYSGEIDSQKAGADLMEKALAAEGFKMTHVIGPKTGHKYEPEAQKQVAKLVDDAVTKGNDFKPAEVRLVTYTLKQNSMKWLRIDGLEKHWEKASVDAKYVDGSIEIHSANVTGLAVNLKQVPGAVKKIVIDGRVVVEANATEGEFLSFVKKGGVWSAEDPREGLRKRHNLQGPIDDAFMDAFILVKPSGKPLNEALGRWALAEFEHARATWRKQMRGEPRVKNDDQINADDRRNFNLILFGDPQSNRVIAQELAKLPLKWDAAGLEFREKKYDCARFAPVLIYLNPSQPERYIVINSGFTFCDTAQALKTNSQQTPKLPDWAVIDITVPREERHDKGVKDAGFFDEGWK